MFVERRSEKGFSFSQPLTDRAFGVVYEGLCTSDKSVVAIKVIPCNTNLPFLDEEAKALHSVKSEYVVKYVDVVVEPREVWVGQFSPFHESASYGVLRQGIDWQLSSQWKEVEGGGDPRYCCLLSIRTERPPQAEDHPSCGSFVTSIRDRTSSPTISSSVIMGQ